MDTENEILLTTPQVAERLGVTVRRVLALIHSGRLPSQQFGRDHVVKESDLALVAERKTGRPPKPTEEEKPQAGKEAIVQETPAKPKKRAVKKAGAKKAAKFRKGSN